MNTINDIFSLCMLMTSTVALAILIASTVLNLVMRGMMALSAAQGKPATVAARNVAEIPATARGTVPALSASSQLAA